MTSKTEEPREPFKWAASFWLAYFWVICFWVSYVWVAYCWATNVWVHMSPELPTSELNQNDSDTCTQSSKLIFMSRIVQTCVLIPMSSTTSAINSSLGDITHYLMYTDAHTNIFPHVQTAYIYWHINTCIDACQHIHVHTCKFSEARMECIGLTIGEPKKMPEGHYQGFYPHIRCRDCVCACVYVCVCLYVLYMYIICIINVHYM